MDFTSRNKIFRLFLLANFLLPCIAIGSLLTIPAPIMAQEDGGGEAPAAEDNGGGEGGEAQQKGNRNLFIHIFYSAGPVFGTVLGLISLGLVALIVILFMELRMGSAIPPGFVDEFSDIVNKRQFKQAFDLCRADGSFLARVLTAGMGRLQYGIEDARHAAFNMVDSIRSGKEQLINYLATIGTIGPMLGLVGTVYGMILAFMELSSGGAPRVGELADQISGALVTTLLGVGIAVPAIFAHSFFRNRLTRLTMDTSNLADDLLTQMFHNSRKPAPAGATANASAPRGAVPNAQAVKPAE